MELPVVDHPEIPVGYYCYKGLEVIKDEFGQVKLKTENCPHWQKTEKGARCNLLNEEHHYQCCFHLLWDQVKHCRINEESHSDNATYDTDEKLIRDGFELVAEVCECGKENQVWARNKK